MHTKYPGNLIQVPSICGSADHHVPMVYGRLLFYYVHTNKQHLNPYNPTSVAYNDDPYFPTAMINKAKTNETKDDLHTLTPAELYWKDHYQWVLDQGYRLSTRYNPARKPSPSPTEDDQTPLRRSITYATRLKDNKQVALKKVDKEHDKEELEIMTLLSREPASSDRRNHCVPLLDTLIPPDANDITIIMVMPMLRSYWMDPEFSTVGEVVDCVSQILEGVLYLHERNIAHRNISAQNIMMDASELFSEPGYLRDEPRTLDYTRFIKPKYRRTDRPVKYYLTDFGLSRQYGEEMEFHIEIFREGTDLSVPEFKTASKEGEEADLDFYDPFPVDVYCLGNLLKKQFVESRRGLDFLHSLVWFTTCENPELRPTMKQVVGIFQENVRGLSSWKLRSQCPSRSADPVGPAIKATRVVQHWIRQLGYSVRRIPAIPVCK